MFKWRGGTRERGEKKARKREEKIRIEGGNGKESICK